MAEQGADHNTNVKQDARAASSIGEEARKQLLLVSASQLRKASPRRQSVAGYRRGDIDYLLERAAMTIDDFAKKVEVLQGKIDGFRSTQATLEDRLKQMKPRSAQEIAGEMFVTAHRAIERVKEDAKREAEQVVADARGQAELILSDAERRREEFEKLRGEAQATIEGVRREALELREVVQAERERLIADSIAEAERARAGLEAEKAKLEAAIAELRGVWVGFISDALARLEVIEPATGLTPEKYGRVTPITQESRRPEGTTPEPSQVDVVSELKDRLPSGGDVRSRPAAGPESPSSGLSHPLAN